MHKSKILLPLIILMLTFSACEEDYSPRPRGYFRISLPQKSYKEYNNPNCPYKFEYPNYSVITQANKDNNCWHNIDFPLFDARLHLSYKEVNGNIKTLLEETRSLAFKHSMKADAIDETLIINNEKQVYGVVYGIKGNAASSTQFFLTDSTEHFLRGALYFSITPNSDSIAPVLNFIQEDIDYLINSFSWQ